MKEQYSYLFQTFYHPYVSTLVRQLNHDGIDGLLRRDLQLEPQKFQPNPPSEPFKTMYDPQYIVTEPYPAEDIDFEPPGAYSQYNWEIFFHVPLLIADRLSKNQRFEEAQRWFHYIFNPMDASSEPAPNRYWQTKKFHQTSDEDYKKQRIESILHLLAKGGDPEAELTPDEQRELNDLKHEVLKWRKYPFRPHMIARLRTTAYQKSVVMKYLDNLIAWGDQLFRRDTIETINEATQLYILAAEILGRRPQDVPPRATARVQTYNSLEPTLGKFSDALVAIEEFIPPSALSEDLVNPDQDVPITMPYFCIPANDKLLGYWDTVADRLFKIRHCMNIEGVERQLPLFEPPIDPGLLVKAAAAGLDLGSVLNDVSAALPHYRFNVFVQKATELCGEVKALGGALLAALEKRDAEELALLRAGHETALLKLVEQVKVEQLNEAAQNLKALRKSRYIAGSRYLHFQKLLGVKSPQVPAEGQTITEPPASAGAAIVDESGVKMTSHERQEITHLGEAHESQTKGSDKQLTASIYHAFPNINVAPFGVGTTIGGSNAGGVASALAGQEQALSAERGHMGLMVGKMGQLVFRENDSILQSNVAAKEIMHIDQQIVAAQIRETVASTDLENHKKQVENVEAVEATMRDKYTNQELYGWMIGQVSGVYFQAYQLAYDVAKRAERTFRFELGLKDSSFVQFGYWDSLHRGLLAGEKLHQDVKRMEAAYLDQNRREYEITKHISLVQLDPLALIELKQTGECFVTLPEVLFDLDFPGHFMRRIKSVSLTIPCVTGPYTGVNCTLTLLKHSIRHGTLGEKYARDLENEDPRFTDSRGAVQSIVTSGPNDSGMFETNLRDERYLPFEGAGTISEWRIELARDFRSFDYDTISDVILHLRYTAKEAGGLLKQKASVELQAAVNELASAHGLLGPARLFSLRHEFSSKWHKFLSPQQPATAEENGDQTLTMALTKDRFPFLFQNKTIAMSALELFVKINPEFVDDHNESSLKLSLEPGTAASQTELTLAPWNGLLRAEKSPADPLGEWTLTAWLDTGDPEHKRLDPDALQDILIVCRYTVS